MKKIFLLISILSCFIISCSYDKGEIPKVLDCVTDSTIHVVPVTISDNSFSPVSITIVAGDTVAWTYTSGSSGHTVTCDGTNGSTLPSGGTTWDSGASSPLAPGNIFKKAIMVPGTYTYICQYHAPGMSGTIVVKSRCH